MSEKILEQETEKELDSIITEFALKPEENPLPDEELNLEKQSLLLVDPNNKIKAITANFTMLNNKHLLQKLKGILSIRVLHKRITTLKGIFSLKGLAQAVTDKNSYHELLETALLNKKLMIISISLGIVAGVILAYI